MLNGIIRDLRAVMERDPACKSWLEAVVCYPGFHALVIHRFAHFLYRRRLFFVARLISGFARCLTGIEIHPGAEIGSGVFIDHGCGVVIGETAIVGDDVTIYQGVTLGGTGKEKGKRHPTIGNNVVISAGAKVLGSFTVGDNSKIGAGAVVLKEVPPNCTVVGVPGRIVAREGRKVEGPDLNHGDLPDPVAQMLSCLAGRVERLEARVRELERGQKMDADPDLQYAEQA